MDSGTNEKLHENPPELTAAQAFDAIFWPAYPRKIGKHEARKAWSSLKLKDDDQKLLDAIMGCLERFIRHEFSPEIRYIPYPATWLRARYWEDA